MMFFFHSFNSLFLFFTNFLFSLFNKTPPTSPKEAPVKFSNKECTRTEEEEEDLIADVIHGGEALLFLHSRINTLDPILVGEEKHPEGNGEISTVDYRTDVLSLASQSDVDHIEKQNGVPNMPMEPLYHQILLAVDATPPGGTDKSLTSGEDQESFSKGGTSDFLVIGGKVREEESEEIFTGSYTGGSASNSSVDRRSSDDFRLSESKDRLSLSSRRSASHSEYYNLHRKYDEEMFLDRVSREKLIETESLRSVEVNPRSISEREVNFFQNERSPYEELEAAYVTQICRTWEELGWSYTNMCRLGARRNDAESLCAGDVAQQFQQFQVLLQRFIENEPFEHGRRPEVYARMKVSTPKLLQVPEFQGSEGDQNKESFENKIPLTKLLMIMEDAIRTFMNFLKADKESYCQIFGAFFRKNKGSVDPALLHLIKKANKKKKMKIKDLQRSRKCFRKRIRLKEEEEMEILMGLIDLKVVSRVSRIPRINADQLQWCEEKMSKVRVWQGKLQRDSSPLSSFLIGSC